MKVHISEAMVTAKLGTMLSFKSRIGISASDFVSVCGNEDEGV